MFTVGLAVTLALIFGITTTALAAAAGDPLKLGRLNSIDEISKLVGSASGALLRIDNDGTGTALDLQVEPGEAPMTVDSDTRVANLNTDEVDGKSADEIGVNGLEQVSSSSVNNSNSSKTATAVCPAGKVVVGTGYSISGGTSGSFPNVETDIVIDTLLPNDLFVTTTALEEEPTGANWSVTARAICATAP